MAAALLEEKLSGAPPCMRCSLINDLMKTTAKVAGPIRVVSGLAPRWAAERPQTRRLVLSGATAVSLLGGFASQRGASPLTTIFNMNGSCDHLE